jgi:hypothetical protein
MSHRTKSGQKSKRHKNKMVWKRRMKRKKAQLIADGKIKKGVAPSPSVANS